MRAAFSHHRLITTVFLLSAVATAAGQTERSAGGAGVLARTTGLQDGEFYRLVRQFDFDERPLGNYEDTPMHWVRLRGEGFPGFARGVLDDHVGHTAPPSFRLSIQTGNVAYEYRNLDLAVAPESDYIIVGHIRAQGLVHARAFLAAHFVDRFGVRVPGSERVSEMVRATGDDDEPWQRVSLSLSSHTAGAYALRIQLWILQGYVWKLVDPDEVDPIVRRDVFGTAWFDDIQVLRLPRARLRFSNPGGLVAPGREEAFILELNSTVAQQLRAELAISDEDGRPVFREVLDIPTERPGVPPPTRNGRLGRAREEAYTLASHAERARTALRVPVPPLPPGLYDARMQLRGASESLLERTVRFAVLPELDAPPAVAGGFGVDLGLWRSADVDGPVELLTQLGCGAARVGVPLSQDLAPADDGGRLFEISNLVRTLAQARIESTGVILATDIPAALDTSATWRLVEQDRNWRTRLSPVLAHFGGLLPTWQLGRERGELRSGGGWTAEAVSELRGHLRRFVTLPRLVIPQPITDPEPLEGDIASVWAPALLSARNLPYALDFLADAPLSARYWIALEGPRAQDGPRLWRQIDLARRIVLAAALNPERVFVEAPMRQVDDGVQALWQPDEYYVPVRTLMHHLADKRCTYAMTPEPSTIALIFGDGHGGRMVLWTWRETPLEEPLSLYLGGAPAAQTIFGQRVPIRVVDGRAQVPVGPVPLIVSDFDPPLLRLQASYRLSPNYVEVHTSKPHPVLSFENPYDTRIQGRVRMAAPESWRVEPDEFTFVLEPGERLEQPLTLTSPPRQVASTYELRTRIQFSGPRDAELDFREPITLGLRDLLFDIHTFWIGDDLVVEQSLRNISSEIVHFSSYCQAPNRPRQERFFLEVQPGQSQVQSFVFPAARELAGANLYVGIEEIHGQRWLNRLVHVPR